MFIKYFKTLSVNHPRLVILSQKRARVFFFSAPATHQQQQPWGGKSRTSPLPSYSVPHITVCSRTPKPLLIAVAAAQLLFDCCFFRCCCCRRHHCHCCCCHCCCHHHHCHHRCCHDCRWRHHYWSQNHRRRNCCLYLGWQCRDLCLSAPPLKRQTFLSVSDMSTMSSRHVGNILLCRPIFRLSMSCRWDLLPTHTPACT